MKLINTPESSTVESIGYDPKTQTLTVNFRSGTTYIYTGVPSNVVTDLILADSIGSYFHANIRGRYTTYKKVA